MTRTSIGVGLATAVALAVSLGAQETSSSARQKAATSGDSITLTGCLQKDASGGYMLANAEIAPASSTSTTTGATTSTGTTGTSTATTTEPPASWMLETSSSDLAPHVGHKIQVTGKANVATSSSTTSTTGTTTTATTTTADEKKASSKTGNTRKLNVTSVKMISSSCA